MKKLLMPLVVAAAMMSAAACGGSDEAKPPAVGQSSTPPTTVATATTATALSQTDFVSKVQAAMLAKSTFHSVTTMTDEDGPLTYTSDVKVASGGTDVSVVSSDGSSARRIGGTFYGKGDGITDTPAKPWKAWNPKAASKDPMAPLTGALMKILTVPALTHEFLAGTAYATKFSSAAGPTVDGVPTTAYTITIDAAKAAAGKAFGEYLTPDVVAEEKLKVIPVTVLVGDDSLPRKLDFTFGTSTISTLYTKFGDPVTVAAPATAQIDA
ncbi:hypothetical protein [Streptomyces sp. SID13031]|uniref:hypothetical protein n=1 Tax=Streptomyces sp. SID13031 TaxID=2706046 RepID=UPI0013C8F623|nr:hypothetical protein [Streptomyces sp. SID13031]NEA32765.1 hypothetical protein [Streptomyces sp. SID13031]